MGAFSGAGGLGRARPPHPRAALGRVADLLGRRRAGGDRQPGPVLELHPGTGVVTGPLTRAGVELVAVEPGEEARRQLRRALHEVQVVAAHASRLPFAADVAAAVLLTDPELLGSPALVEELDRVLGVGGLVVLLARVGPGGLPQLSGFDGPVATDHAGEPADGASVVAEWRRS